VFASGCFDTLAQQKEKAATRAAMRAEEKEWESSESEDEEHDTTM
jgi:hypothetical protein